MTLHPDKLFRDKFLEHKKSAPDAAWARIEKNLDKPRSRVIWIKIAAAIFVLLIPGYLIMTKDKIETEVVVSERIDPQVQEPLLLNKNEEVVTKNESENNEPQSVELPKQTSSSKDKLTKRKVESIEINIAKENAIVIQEPPVKDLITITKSEDQSSINKEGAPQIKSEKASTVIIYTSEEVDAKFLRMKKPTEKPAVKRFDGMRTVTDLVYNIKTSDRVIGDLREWKDEVLSFDFATNNDKSLKTKN